MLKRLRVEAPPEYCRQPGLASPGGWWDLPGCFDRTLGVQQPLLRHADIRTTMNVYGDAMTEDMAKAHGKIVRLALPRA